MLNVTKMEVVEEVDMAFYEMPHEDIDTPHGGTASATR